MSKNAKNARNNRAAHARAHQKGPASTKKLHTKLRTWYNENSPTFWKKPKEVKKVRGDDERAALDFFRALRTETEKAHRLQKMRDNMGA
jgi:mRNA-degrading endonuclease HigB of HigAB toxin-antitoxin module